MMETASNKQALMVGRKIRSLADRVPESGEISTQAMIR
jgi:hypothetical protein